MPNEGISEEFSPRGFLVESLDKFLDELLLKYLVESQEDFLLESLV